MYPDVRRLERSSVPTSRFSNYLLQSLSPAISERLHLRRVRLEVGRVMEFPGMSINNLFFIEDGVGSMTSTFQDGSEVEVGMFGCESVIGISALMGVKRSLNRVYMQLAGSGYMSPIEAAKMEFTQCEDFQRLALRYVQTQLIQATQTAGCNARHNIEQRLARWLLLVADRAGTPLLRISHQFLADMLGVTRPSVAITAHQLRERGLIDYQRAVIQITDREGLERCTCECYGIVRRYLDSYAEFETDLTT
jgi:CRP-like cAMP-binding protein